MSQLGTARLPIVALVFGVLATVLAVFALLRDVSGGDQVDGRATRIAVETRDALTELEARVDALDARLEHARARRRGTEGSAPAPSASPDRATPGAAAPEDLVARMAEMERRISELVDRPSFPGRSSQMERPKPSDLPGLSRIAEDRAATADERLAALRKLRHLPGGRSRAVTLAMIDLYRQNPEPEIRTDIFRQLSGVTEPELMDVLLEALRDDPHHKVREEAVETLADFDDPRAREAMEYAAEHDLHEDVREEAQKRLRFGARR